MSHCTEIKSVLQTLSQSNTQDLCNLMQDGKKYMDEDKEENANGFVKMTGGYEDYRWKKREEKRLKTK